MTLRARLTLSAAAAVALAVVLASIAVYFVVRSELRNEVDDALQGRATSIGGPFDRGDRRLSRTHRRRSSAGREAISSS